jgi:hypothetical protein
VSAGLAGLADWIDDRLGNEHVDRQAVCEEAAARLRKMSVGAAVVLDEAQLDVVLDALADAAEYRIAAGARGCLDCASADGPGLCPDHDADLDRAQRYTATARQLRMEAGR